VSSVHNPHRKKHSLSSRDGGARCAYCGRREKLRRLTIDHRLPKSRGGSNGLDNLVLACTACNHAKAARLPGEWSAPTFGARSAATWRPNKA
jgi:5-methylcytosine-specific restriction endonuclease McrA